MTLKQFIEKWICKNSIIRLWFPDKESGGHILLGWQFDCGAVMEWEILDGSSFQSRYLNHEVIGVTDIRHDHYPEAINIVIKPNLVDQISSNARID